LLVDIAIYEGVDELDVVGPFEVLRRAEVLGAEVSCRLRALTAEGPVFGAFGLPFPVSGTFVPGEADVVLVPGGGWVTRSDRGAWSEVKRGEWPRLLLEASRAGSAMAGVCTGAMLLAHAGVIGTRRATTHHDALDDLAALGATVVSERVVDDGDLITSGGVTSGLDLALWLVARSCGSELAEVIGDGLEYAWTRLESVPARP
jgi:transcriptional regulator GlxA family with amidase domain